MIASSRSLKLIAVAGAVVLHGALAGALIREEPVLVEGSGVQEAALGSSFADMAVGTLTAEPTTEVTEPVETPEQPLETAPDEVSDPTPEPSPQPAVEAAVTPVPDQPVEAERPAPLGRGGLPTDPQHPDAAAP